MNEKVVKCLLIITSPIWFIPMLMLKYSDQVEKIILIGFEASQFFKILWMLLVSTAHFLGLLIIVLLSLTSTMAFLYVTANEFGLEWFPWFSEYYSHILKIIENPVSWAAATTIIATTVAIGHMKNLDLNRSRFFEEQKDRWKKEYEEKTQREIKRHNIVK